MRERKAPTPMAIGPLLRHAAQLAGAGRLAEAEAVCRRVLRTAPRQFDAMLTLGMILIQGGNPDQAIPLLEKATRLQPRSLAARLVLGDALCDTRKPEAALASYDLALRIEPGNAAVLNNRATALRELGRRDEALVGYERAIGVDPTFTEAFNNRGHLLTEMGRTIEAIDSYDRALATAPQDPIAAFGRGTVLASLGRHEEAVASFTAALTTRPGFAEAIYNCANSLRTLGRRDAALAAYSRAVACRPDYPEALNNRGLLLTDMGRTAEAIASFDRAVALRPAFADALFNCGVALHREARYDAALEKFAAALHHDPDYSEAAAMVVEARRHLCEWDRFEADRDDLARRIEGSQKLAPFVALFSFDSHELHSNAARTWMAHRTRSVGVNVPRPASYRHDRIRIAYVSADFRVHPMAYLTAPLFERHDRNRFEIYGVSIGRRDDSLPRRRVEAACDVFLDVADHTDQAAAALLREREIDIAVDLMGHTMDARPGLFALRPAPVQVNFLGYPGTTGADFIDAIVVDHTLMRSGEDRFFTERPVFMPGSYQVNEPGRIDRDPGVGRAAFGLPEDGVVLSCFNQPYKITPDVFAIWMRLLDRVPRSSLWLYAANARARANLEQAAQRHGVPAARLIFAVPIERDQHLRRVAYADLFLDTFPYGAHTTASDALRAGVPVVTCSGRTFPTRVGESLLRAIDVPELVTYSLAEYEDMSLRLASDPVRMSRLRQTILAKAPASSLFDAGRFCRDIEAAYVRLVSGGIVG